MPKAIYALIDQANSNSKNAARGNARGSSASDLLVTLPRNPIAAMAAQTALIKRQKIICEVISESKVAAIAEKNDRDIEYIEVFALHSISLRHVFDELRSLSID